MRQKWSPYDLPYLREAQVAAWLKLAEFWGRPEAHTREKVPGSTALDFHAMADALREAPLTWIAEFVIAFSGLIRLPQRPHSRNCWSTITTPISTIRSRRTLNPVVSVSTMP